jgi:hypothetical protein
MIGAVAIAIDRLAVSVSLSRESGGVYDDNGKWTPNPAIQTTILAVIQPASGSELMDVPEGIRSEARWLLWSRSEIKVDDKVTARGISYRAMYLWPRDEGGFYRAAIGRVP